MLENDPKKRLSIPQILCHKWFAYYDPNSKFINLTKISLHFHTRRKGKNMKEFTYSKRIERTSQMNIIK